MPNSRAVAAAFDRQCALDHLEHVARLLGHPSRKIEGGTVDLGRGCHAIEEPELAQFRAQVELGGQHHLDRVVVTDQSR